MSVVAFTRVGSRVLVVGVQIVLFSQLIGVSRVTSLWGKLALHNPVVQLPHRPQFLPRLSLQLQLQLPLELVVLAVAATLPRWMFAR